MTLCCNDAQGGFDEAALLELQRQQRVLAFREHFFTVHDVPHVACVLTCADEDQATADEPSQSSRTAARTNGSVPLPTGTVIG